MQSSITAVLSPRNVLILKQRPLRAAPRESAALRGLPSWEPGDAWEPALSGEALDHALDFNCEFQEVQNILPGGRGGTPKLTRFGRKGWERIMDGGGIIDRLGWGSVLVTLTIPGSGVKIAKEISRWSGFCVNSFTQYLRDLDRRLGTTHHRMHVWEWQRRGMLHLHLVIASPCNSFLSTVQEQSKKWWCSVLDKVSARSGRDVWAKTANYSHSQNKSVLQVDCTPIQKTAAGYLAKYLSKNTTKEVRKGWFCPSRWWSVSRGLLSQLRASYVYICVPVFQNSLEDALLHVSELITPLSSSSKLVPIRYSKSYFISLVIPVENQKTVVQQLMSLEGDGMAWSIENRKEKRFEDKLVGALSGVYLPLLEEDALSQIAFCREIPVPRFWSYRVETVKGYLEYAALRLFYSGDFPGPPGRSFESALQMAREGKLYQHLLYCSLVQALKRSEA